MNVSIQEILTQAFGFVILFFILKKYAWKPILELLETRRTKISSSFDEIESTKKELEQLKVDYTDRITHIEEESRSKLQAAVQEGKHVAREIQDSARKQAKEVLEKAKSDLELESAKARATLRKEMALLVSFATERLVKEKLTDKKDEETILQFIKELEESKETLT